MSRTSRVTPLDLSFLLLENATRRMHMTAFMVFEIPPGQERSYVPRLVESFRASEAGPPFDRQLKWLRPGVAEWRTVRPDMSYHVRHIALPAPGSMAQFHETISFLNTSQLDRGHPLWECYVIEGIAPNRVAVLIKVHHALIDGEGGLRAMRNALSDSARDTHLRAPWGANETADKKRAPRPRPAATEKIQSLLKRLVKLPGDLVGIGGEVVDLGAQSLKLKPRETGLPFAARRTPFNNSARSAARAYANIELPLAQIKALANASETSLNDVVMTLIDTALHGYLREHDAATDRPLVALMPMSLRDESSGGGGNQVSAELIALGAPAATIRERLAQINAATRRAKDKGKRQAKELRQAWSLLVAGSMALADTLPLFGKTPSANLVISNMKGPAEQLYLAGAPMVAFHGLPILPPGAGLNITFASVGQAICLAIGAAPEAVHEPYRVAQLIEQALADLQRALKVSPDGTAPSAAKRAPKTAPKAAPKDAPAKSAKPAKPAAARRRQTA